MDLRHVLAAFHRWRAVMVLIILVLVGAAAAYATVTPRVYAAKTTVFFTLQSSPTGSTLAQGSTYTQNAAKSYSELVTLDLVLNPVIAQLGLDMTPGQLAQQISVGTQPDTVLATITATADEPQLAADIANTVAAEFGKAVTGLAPGGQGSAAAVQVKQVSTATPPKAPISPNVRVIVLMGVVGGLFLAVSAAILLDLLASPLVNEERIEQDSQVLGKISRDAKARSQPLPILSHPTQARAESFRALRTNLRHLHDAETDAAQCLVVTSPRRRDGRSQVAVNLALTVAQSHRRVLLIDGDLRNPSVATKLGLESRHGLSDILVGEARVEDAVRSMSAETWRDPTLLDVLGAGQHAPDPGELFARPMMGELLEDARKRYDMVIIDTPALLPVTDAALLAAQADGALLVVNHRSTTERDFEEAQTVLGLAGARVYGVVINAVRFRRSSGLGGQLYGPRSRAWRR